VNSSWNKCYLILVRRSSKTDENRPHVKKPLMVAATRIGLSLIAFARVVSAAAAEIHVLSAVGMRQPMLELAPKFEAATGHKVAISFDSGGVIPSRLARGETVDVVLVPRAAAELKAGRILAGPVDVAISRVGIAVRAGARRPDVSTVSAFKQAMLKAKKIACPDPALGGSSGVHIAKVFERIGIADAVKPKLVYSSTPGEADTMPGHLLARGRADIALHQLQELMAVPGVEILGPFPKSLEGTFVFSAAVLKGAPEIEPAKALVDFLATPEARGVIKSKGMELAVP
jgi:molybdate transport system substrate-binding protein